MTDLIIPRKVLAQTGMSPEAFLLEIAVHLFCKGYLSQEEARDLAGLDRAAFQQELTRRKVDVEAEFEDYWKDMHCL
jgi:predicted HTH domain antitoxin